MTSKNELMNTGSRILSEASHTLAHPTEKPYRTTSMLLAILGAIGFVWLFPELRRYLRMERM
jgi:hypothetical protein